MRKLTNNQKFQQYTDITLITTFTSCIVLLVINVIIYGVGGQREVAECMQYTKYQLNK